MTDAQHSRSESRRIFGLDAIEDALKFSVATTGGNTTALSRKFGTWTVQITADADGNVPTTDDEAITIFLHCPSGPIAHHRCPNAEEARVWLVEFVAFVESGERGGDPDQFEWDFP